MLQQAPPLTFLILFSCVMFLFFFMSNANSNIYVQCSQLNFTSMSPYESNVNLLLTSLDDSSSIYNFNKFQTSPQSDSVYGLFQCRGDLITLDCKDCVASAISQLKTTCPVSIGGEIQLDGCFVKYDDTSFFGTQDKTEVCKRCGPSFGYNSDVLNRIDGALVHLVGGNGEYFREGDFGSIQGVTQCLQDLSLSDCQDCLAEASGRLRSECETSTWGEMYLGKCYIRYADQGNENISNNPNSSSKKGSGGGNVGKKIYYILGAILGSAALSFGFSCCNTYVAQDLKRVTAETDKEVKVLKTATERDVKDLKRVADGTERDVKYIADDVKDIKKVTDVVIAPAAAYYQDPRPYYQDPRPYNVNLCSLL